MSLPKDYKVYTIEGELCEVSAGDSFAPVETLKTKFAVERGVAQLAAGYVHIVAVHFKSELIKKYSSLPLRKLYDADAYIVLGTESSYERPLFLAPWCASTLSSLSPISGCDEFTALLYSADVYDRILHNYSGIDPMCIDIHVQ